MQQERIQSLAEEIRKEQERLSSDMYNRCTSAHKPFLEHEFELIQGTYNGLVSKEFERRSGKKVNIAHDFVYHPRARTYVDITADKFHPSQPEILIMKETDTRIGTTHLLSR